MPKESKETIIKNGKTYYTSTYFANKVNLSKRAARDYLKDFTHEDISENPKLYKKSIINKAITSYQKKTSSISEADIEAKILAKELERAKDVYMQIHKVTESEIEEMEKNNYNFLEPKEIQEPGISMEEISKIIVKNTKSTINAMMNLINNSLIHESSEKYDIFLTLVIKNLFSILGYEFDFKQVEHDIRTTEYYWRHKGPDTAKSLSEIEAFNRMDSNDGYLIKIK